MIPPLAGATSTDVSPQTTTSRDSKFADALAGALAVGDVLAAAAAAAPPLPLPVTADATTESAPTEVGVATDAAPDLATVGTDGPDAVPVGVEMPVLELVDLLTHSPGSTPDRATPDADAATVTAVPTAPAPGVDPSTIRAVVGAPAPVLSTAQIPAPPTVASPTGTDRPVTPALETAAPVTGDVLPTVDPTAAGNHDPAPQIDAATTSEAQVPGPEATALDALPSSVDPQPRLESRAPTASAAGPASAPALPSGATAPAPGSSAAAAATDTVRYLREIGPARAVQRLAVDLDGATVALRIDRAGPSPSIHVHVVDDPAGRLDQSWTAGVERTLAQAFGQEHPGGDRRHDQHRRSADREDLPPPPASRRWAEALTGVRP